MMPTPDQRRNSGELSVMIFHNSGKLKTLMLFPSIFSGKHVKHKNQVEILTGKEITVEFDRPAALQIDGETVLGISSYTARASRSSSGGLKEICGTAPINGGTVTVILNEEKISVTATKAGGTLVWKGKKYCLETNKALVIEL